MAVVGDEYFLSITLADNGGQETTRVYEMRATTQEGAETDAPLAVAAILAVTDDVLVSWHFYERMRNDALVYPASGIENQNQALLRFVLAGDPSKKATLSIPAPKPTLFVATSGEGANVIDNADAAVAAFAALFTAAGTLYLSDGEIAASLLGGKRRHVRSNVG